MPATQLSNTNDFNARKSPCGGCQRQKFIEFIEDTKPDGHEELQAELREPCPCKPVKRYVEGVKRDYDAPPSNYWDTIDEMVPYYDDLDDFIRAFGFKGYNAAYSLSNEEVFAVLSERIKK